MIPSSKSSSHIILVTGGGGYLGSQLIRDLAIDPNFSGHTIRILDNMANGDYRALMNLPVEGNYQIVEGDILDPGTLRIALKDVEVVIHLAAIVRTPMSFEYPSWVTQVNRWGTVRLIEACLESNVTRFIFASSTAAYGPGDNFSEDEPCHPVGPYAQSKYQAEKDILQSMTRGLLPTILRFGILYGYAPVMRFDAVFNKFAYLAGVGRPLTIFGSGSQLRPCIHIRDASSVIRFALSRPEETTGEIINSVSENLSVLDLTNTINALHAELPVLFTDQDVLTHLSFSVDNNKLLDLGWKLQVLFQDGIEEVINQFSGFSAVKIHQPEIDEF